MGKKLTWEMIYADLRMRLPHRRNDIIHWHPYDYLTIKVYFKEGARATYNYLTHELKFVKD